MPQVIKFPICKICGSDIRLLHESMREHIAKHGYNFKRYNGVAHYFGVEA